MQKYPQRLKRLPAMQETWVQFLGQDDPLDPIIFLNVLIVLCGSCQTINSTAD